MDFYTDNGDHTNDHNNNSSSNSKQENNQPTAHPGADGHNPVYDPIVSSTSTYNAAYRPEEPEVTKSSKKKGSGFGTGFAISMLLVILLVLIASAVIFGDEPSLPMLSPMPSPSVLPTGAPEDPYTTDGSSILVTPMPIVTARPMATLDGVAPSITDPYNPFPDIIEGVSAGVVSIINYEQSDLSGFITSNQIQSSGSGFIISSDGYILTNAHVIADAHSVGVVFNNGFECAADVIGYDTIMDVAVLYVDLSSTNLLPLKLGDSDTCRVGEFVIAIGDPTGTTLASTPTFGIISALEREINIDGHTNAYIQTDAAINPGNSGGPLINNRGEVIGMTTAKTITASYDEYGNPISAEGLGFALPIRNVLKIAEALITQGELQRPGIGLSTVAIDEYISKKYDRPIGLLVYSVILDSPAFKAGLRADDIILSCNSIELYGNEALSGIIQSMNVGDEITVQYWRNGQIYECTIGLGDLNSMGDTIYNDEYGGSWLE